MTGLRPKVGFSWGRVNWGHPDSRRSAVCSYCYGLPGEVPLILTAESGHVAQFCDECQRRWFGLESYDGEPE